MSTGTSTATFTRTNARYLASKVGADLRQMRLFHGHPSPDRIDNYIDELVEMLVKKWVDTVEYGFRDSSGDFVLSLYYIVRRDGTINNAGAGDVPSRADLSGTTFGSFMTYTAEYDAASESERQRIRDGLAIQRTSSSTPGHTGGYWESGKSYASGGVGMRREVFRPA